MKAIDLYSGVGGWSIGLKLAGLEVVESFEWWTPAVTTHRANLDGVVRQANIRELNLESLPKNIDVVVGSPPCTQFSYSNRGGSGDLDDGLQDLYAFFRVVDFVKPKYWAFENVPRVKAVIDAAREAPGILQTFRSLLKDCTAIVVDMSDYGVPQTRKRCIVTNIEASSLLGLAGNFQPKSLGEIVTSLKSGTDPLYCKLDGASITDNELEPFLNEEEARFNREMKLAHPIYNRMSFPDRSNHPARTVTATCTRVSRESIIFEEDGKYRRLSVRERASVQSFPISYQFHGKSHSEKLKMIGNAIPPYFTYQLAELFKGNLAPSSPENQDVSSIIKFNVAPSTSPDKQGQVYPKNRRFRFSIPGLNFKSGTRFELNNSRSPDVWKIDFFYGNSKQIAQFSFDDPLLKTIQGDDILRPIYTKAANELRELSPNNISAVLQSNWTHSQKDFHPFTYLDLLGQIAATTETSLSKSAPQELLINFAVSNCDTQRMKISMRKIEMNSCKIVAGLIVGYAFNQMEAA